MKRATLTYWTDDTVPDLGDILAPHDVTCAPDFRMPADADLCHQREAAAKAVAACQVRHGRARTHSVRDTDAGVGAEPVATGLAVSMPPVSSIWT